MRRTNLTLTLDADLLLAARKLALERETSVNQLVRDHLTQLVRETDQQQQALADLKEFFRTSPFEIGVTR